MNDLDSEFWRRVRITPACWEWQGARVNGDYGIFHLGLEFRVRAHRYSYEMHHGHIPDGLIVRHKCDNPPCVNPDHLEVGTHADNARDKVMRGRQPRGSAIGIARLTDEQVLEIRSSPDTQRRIAKLYGVSQPTVSHIKNGKRWGWLS